MSAGLTGVVVAVVVAVGVLVWLVAETALGRGADRSRARPPVAERWQRRTAAAPGSINTSKPKPSRKIATAW